MNRRNLLKTFLAAPAIIRSGVLMPVVPLVAPATPWFGMDFGREILTGTEVLRRQAALDGAGGWRAMEVPQAGTHYQTAREIMARIAESQRNWQEIYSRPVGTTDWPPHLAEALRRQPGSLWAAGVRA